MGAIWFDFAADPVNERPDLIRLVTVLPAPNGLKYLAMQQDLAGISCQIRQHLELATRE